MTLLGAVLVCASLVAAVAIYSVTSWRPTPSFLGSGITRDSITVEVIETAPAGLDNPSIRNTPDIWRELVENANKTIDMEVYTVYEYSSGPIADFHNAIYNAAGRGVRVRMLIDNGIYQNPSVRAVMDKFDAQENIEVRPFSRPMHSKVIIVDNEAAYVGSANQSFTAMESNREIGLLVHSSEIARALAAIFEAGWTGDENQPGFENGWGIQWIYPVVTPIEVPSWVPSTENTIIGLINSAQSTIHAPIYAFSGYPATLPAAVEDAANRGVSIQIVVDKEFGDPHEFPVLETLTKNPNIQIKTNDLGDYSVAHSKAVIVDGKWAYVGSANWSMTSMTSRREVGIAFEDQTLASALEEIFRTDWESEYASWVREPPSPLVQIFIHTVAILAAMSLIVAAILIKRRVKERRRRRKWIAELWASSRHEI